MREREKEREIRYVIELEREMIDRVKDIRGREENDES